MTPIHGLKAAEKEQKVSREVLGQQVKGDRNQFPWTSKGRERMAGPAAVTHQLARYFWGSGSEVPPL